MTMAATAGGDVRTGGMTAEERKVIFASSLGTVFEWYDFYIYGTLGAFLAKYFFSNVPPNVGFIFALLAFAAGFAVRPFGALIFGRLGDMIGRKYTFLITMTLMGIGTFFIGLLAELCDLGHRRAGRSDRAAAGPGPCARRRIWRCRDLRRRACAGEQARLLHLLDSDHGDARSVHGAAAHSGHPHLDGRSVVRRLGLAHSVPAVGHPARGLDLDPIEPERIADLREDEGRGQDLEAAAGRSVRRMVECQDRDPGPVRRDRGRSRRLVRRTVLRAVLPDPDPQGAGA